MAKIISQNRENKPHCKTLRFKPENCIACFLCVYSCPQKAIKLTDGVVTFSSNCRFCLSCWETCPNEAIEIR